MKKKQMVWFTLAKKLHFQRRLNNGKINLGYGWW